MDKVSIYIKKLIALVLSAFVMFLLLKVIPLYPALAFSFLVLSYLHFTITGEKPAYLFGMAKSDQYLEARGGFWLLFRWILMLFGFLYDLVVWILNGIFVLFIIFIDILLLIKTIVFWIIHAFIWFLKLFIPPLVFLYRMILHYGIQWPWWIYRITYRNAGMSVNANFYRVSLRGAVLSLFILLLFYGTGILTGSPVIGAFGMVFSVLPVIWAFGEISSMRFEKRWNTGFSEVKSRFNSGLNAVRAVLSYITIMLAGIIIEIVLDMLGWIPGSGFSLLGISINVNTFVSLILLFVLVILLFASLMIPPHMVHDKDFNTRIPGSIKFLGVIGRKFLRYLFALVPAGFFGAILAIIPAIVVGLAVYITLNVKNVILDAHIARIHHAALTLGGIQRLEMENQVERLNYYKDFPGNVFGDFTNIRTLDQRRKSLQLNYQKGLEEMNRLEKLYLRDQDSLNAEIEKLKNATDSQQLAVNESMKNRVRNRKAEFGTWKSKRTVELEKISLKIKDLKSRIVQLPIAFFFAILWVALFGGLVIAVILSYLGNVFFALYGLKEDGKPSFWNQVADEMNRKDHNQPLLGFTLLVIVVAGIMIFIFLGFPFFPGS